ncbi:MAG TPA: hypothetical protein VFB90_01155 [Dehalococcoidia bacterium]|nr:hypothetical protein [Dehalococcoidia bacterium]
MTTQPPSGPIRHRVQEIMLESLQAIKEGLPAEALSDEAWQQLDACIRTLEPMEGFGIRDANIRMSALARSVRAATDYLLPQVDASHLDLRDFPAALERIERELRDGAAR